MRKPLVTSTIVALVAVGCASGPVEPLPPLKSPATAATVVVERRATLIGLPATMYFSIDDKRIYAVQAGQAFIFDIDAGEYIFGYRLAFNQCRQRVILEAGRSYDVELAPVCDIRPKVRTGHTHPVYASPLSGQAASASSGSTGVRTEADAGQSRETWLE